MEKTINRGCSGFGIIEVMMAVAIISVLAAIALPNYISYADRARAIHCLANRYHAEQEFFSTDSSRLEHRRETVRNLQARLFETHPLFTLFDRALSSCRNSAHAAVEDYRCPLGGVYVVVRDDKDLDRPRVICSIHGGTVPPSEQVEKKSDFLFRTDFDNLEKTVSHFGKWRSQSGYLVPDEKQGVEHIIVFGDRAWTDYEIRVTTTLFSGDGYGIYYRGDGEKQITSYIFQYDPGYGEFIVRKVFNGKEHSPFQRTKIPKNFPVYNQSHEISITVEGDRHIIKIDGHVILSFTDGEFKNGSAGFRTWHKSQASFDHAFVVGLDRS